MPRKPRLTLYQAVAFIVNNDDLQVPLGQESLRFLAGVVSVGVVAAVYGVTPRYVAALVIDYQAERM